jgi:hypothetical protein
MTLISANNLSYSSWNMESINMKGPVTPLFALYDVTYDWENVLSLENYEYNDYGYKQCNKTTDEQTKEYCTEGGYHKLHLRNFPLSTQKTYQDCIA